MQKILTMRSLTTFISLFCYLSVLIITSRGADTIAANQTIKDGETLMSIDETYEMGFFSFQNSSSLRYFGIWYYKIPRDRVVWVANRNTPIRDSTGFLNLDEMGILTLNHNNSVIWSSNTSRQASNPVAQLLDSGNLIVRNQNENRRDLFLWESFHEPGNTFLPGMKIGRSADGFFTYNLAWKSIDDPTEGDYILELGPSGLELEITNNSTVTARSGVWNGIGFSGVPHLRPNPLFTYDFVYNDIERYYTYELINASVITKLVLNPNGVWERRTWVDRTNEWVIYSTSPADICDTYKFCGAYGTCTVGNNPVCGCLSGFVTRDQFNWDRADWSGGCVRRTALDCKSDGFVRYSNIKLPDMKNFLRNASMTLEECRTKCLNNCSCTAYANADIRKGGSGCLLWYGDLLDIKQYRTDGQDLYIRMAASEIAVERRSNSIRKEKVGIIVGVVLSASLLLSLGLCLFTWKKKKGRYGSVEAPRETENIERERCMSYQDEDMDLPHYELSALAVATDNFLFSNMIGEGGFGPVYKGTLEDGLEIAVKRLSRESKQGVYEFKNEVKCIAKLQHRNLVKLLGYCIQMEENILIYEYMPNKSLDYYICDNTRRTLLDWNMRFHIINGISRGLLYLHQDSRLRIIHRDLKLSNILLDKDMNPKISDFGLARSFGGNETAANTKRVVGTYGYMSPEYAIDGLFSIKSDVFSFGVLVIEIVSGKRNRGFSHEGHQLNLIGHAWKLYKEGRSIELIDASIEESCNSPEVLRSIQVGLLCVQHSPDDRPTMASVVLMLSGDGGLAEPKEPGFFTERKLVDMSSSSGKPDSCSVNEVTVTLIDAR